MRRSRGGIRATDERSETGTRGDVRAVLMGLVAFFVCVFVSPRRIDAGDVANGLYGPGRGGLGHATRASLTGGCESKANSGHNVPRIPKDTRDSKDRIEWSCLIAV